ncbi:Hypothetical predicted protein [Olea europaea subsp. europaea]|uniref:Uncharacterized protein n=1 Tax=Olea europaea subsp. europaea TaxID=158383 RepID=A0A8S0T630_OLEEU|nr:Hypothetical predicted protein [Olea europaea subsp. europaea]
MKVQKEMSRVYGEACEAVCGRGGVLENGSQSPKEDEHQLFTSEGLPCSSMAHNNDKGRVHPRDAGRRETDAELWTVIDEQQQSMGRLEAMVQRLLEQQPNPLLVNVPAPSEEDANG